MKNCNILGTQIGAIKLNSNAKMFLHSIQVQILTDVIFRMQMAKQTHQHGKNLHLG